MNLNTYNKLNKCNKFNKYFAYLITKFNIEVLLDFTNKENSILIDYKLTKPKPPANSIYRFQGAFWAEPDVSQTREIVKEIHSNPAIRANYSKIAKQSINNYI